MGTDLRGAHGASAREELLSHLSTGNARPILAEISSALEKLLSTGETTTIDLGAIPFAPGDERLLDEVLGVGEVRATLEALGQSIVHETRYPGVWRIDHLDPHGETLSRFIEVTFIPDILKSQHADAVAGLARLTARLEELDG